jgi:hypothetical protein
MIPLLITMDLEIAHDHAIKEQEIITEKLCKDLKSLNLPITVFTTSEYAERFPEQIKGLSLSGNEIGCHGLNHSIKENYKKIEEDKIKYYLSNAESNIESVSGKKPVCFRGPGMTTSAKTQKILVQNGYAADFSVCSQRIDFFNSKGGDIRWLFAPRNQYNPSGISPYRKGDLPIRVIPLSSIMFPFMSGTLYLFGLKFMKKFFDLLIKEASKKCNPIVYLFHSYEFTGPAGNNSKGNDSGKTDFYKRPLIHRLYKSDIRERYKMNMDLIKYMLSNDSVRPFTGNNYCEFLDKKNN